MTSVEPKIKDANKAFRHGDWFRALYGYLEILRQEKRFAAIAGINLNAGLCLNRIRKLDATADRLELASALDNLEAKIWVRALRILSRHASDHRAHNHDLVM